YSNDYCYCFNYGNHEVVSNNDFINIYKHNKIKLNVYVIQSSTLIVTQKTILIEYQINNRIHGVILSHPEKDQIGDIINIPSNTFGLRKDNRLTMMYPLL